LTRSLGNDAIQSLAGELLANTQPYVIPFVNSAYRHLQRRLINNGVLAPITVDTQLFNITAIPQAVVDPATQVLIGYNGYFDGLSTHANPVLPSDLLVPLRLFERQHNTTQIYIPMFSTVDGLPTRPQGIRLQDWEWRTDQIRMVGATMNNDIRLIYA